MRKKYLITGISICCALVIILIVFVYSCNSCTGSNSSLTSSSSSDSDDLFDYNDDNDDNSLSDEEIETKAVQALYEKVKLTFGDDIDPDSTKYRINKIEHGDLNSVKVYGTYTTYDKYGRLYGDVGDPFTVFIIGSKVECDLF